jgi:hypothetical protein
MRVDQRAGLKVVKKELSSSLYLFNNALSTENAYSFGLEVLQISPLKAYGSKR